jgi:glycosyltransferase involved in cell wall biosynthesis
VADCLEGNEMKRLKVLMSAYACEPDMGSEPGVGWNMAREMAKYHDIWVITRANNREVIEAELENNPVDGLHFVYYDLPRCARWWKKGGRGVQLYYYLWQLGIYPLAKRLHRDVGFNLAHHVTFGRYWSPSLLVHLGIPFVWGTVGGGESMPTLFKRALPITIAAYELKRDFARFFGEHDPLVRLTARFSAFALASTDQTATRLSELGCKTVTIAPQVALTFNQIDHLADFMSSSNNPVRFVSIGRPQYWKGFDLALQAFSRVCTPDIEYWFIANGVGRRRLENLVLSLGIESRVRFFDPQPTLNDVYRILKQCNVLVHPALHEAFGNVVLEAMAVGKPVICLDIGGPAVQVTEETGFKIPAISPEQAIDGMAETMMQLAQNHELRRQMGAAARKRVKEHFNWDKKGEYLVKIYAMMINNES